jgi:hypothetical protein
MRWFELRFDQQFSFVLLDPSWPMLLLTRWSVYPRDQGSDTNWKDLIGLEGEWICLLQNLKLKNLNLRKLNTRPEVPVVWIRSFGKGDQNFRCRPSDFWCPKWATKSKWIELGFQIQVLPHPPRGCWWVCWTPQGLAPHQIVDQDLPPKKMGVDRKNNKNTRTNGSRCYRQSKTSYFYRGSKIPTKEFFLVVEVTTKVWPLRSPPSSNHER